MRLPRLRMTTRWWMIAVVVVGIVFAGVEVLRQRRAFALAMASRHAASASAASPFDLRNLHHELMEQKWRTAARYPWLPFEPDPPGP
jgi:hypothetical protein